MRLGQSVSGTIREFIKDPRVAQMLDHYVQYVGSAPDNSPAILCSIGHMQAEQGIWYPRGGTRAVPQALVRLGSELGVRYHTSIEIRRLLTEGGAIAGLETSDGELHRFDAVVSNEDAVRTYRELLGGSVAAAVRQTKDYEPACSGVVLYLGLKQRTSIWRITTLFFPAIRTRSFTTSTISPSLLRTQPAISPRLRPPIRPPRLREATRYMCSCTRPFCARSMTGRRCSPPIAR